MDHLSPERRSWNMGRIGSKNTKPELIVRSLLHRMGLRFRLHRKDLPGKPDIVLPKHKTVIFVHGCYWHRHSCSAGKVVPKTNSQFWMDKFMANKRRDCSNVRQLKQEGWRVLVIWECKTTDLAGLEAMITRFLS